LRLDCTWLRVRLKFGNAILFVWIKCYWNFYNNWFGHSTFCPFDSFKICPRHSLDESNVDNTSSDNIIDQKTDDQCTYKLELWRDKIQLTWQMDSSDSLVIYSIFNHNKIKICIKSSGWNTMIKDVIANLNNWNDKHTKRHEWGLGWSTLDVLMFCWSIPNLITSRCSNRWSIVLFF